MALTNPGSIQQIGARESKPRSFRFRFRRLFVGWHRVLVSDCAPLSQKVCRAFSNRNQNAHQLCTLTESNSHDAHYEALRDDLLCK